MMYDDFRLAKAYSRPFGSFFVIVRELWNLTKDELATLSSEGRVQKQATLGGNGSEAG